MSKFSVSIFFLLFSFCSCKISFSVNSDRNRIVDNYGRERVFHGTNVVFKTSPFIPISSHFDARYSFSEEDARLLASMGYTTIRLGVLWAGLEPTRGVYNLTYLEEAIQIVEIAGAHGLYVVIDMHQDVFNRKYCGNGVPDWAAVPHEENFPYPIEVEYEKDNNSYPRREDCNSVQWPNYHFTTALSKSVGRFYDNYEGLLEQFAKFWGKVAETFADFEEVLGYEIMNEPWCGDVFEDPTLLVPGVADRRYLQPMYDLVNTEIRKYDQEHLILFEAVTWELIGLGEALGFTHPPGGEEFRNRSVLAFHKSVSTDITSHEDFWDFKWKEIQRLGVAGFITETNSCCLDTMDELGKWGYSWHHWAYKLYGDWTWDSSGHWNLGSDRNNYTCPTVDSCLDRDSVTTYARVYPTAIAGQGNFFQFNSDINVGILVYQPDPNISQPTEIKVPEIWRYKEGFTVEIEPQGVAEWAQLCCTEAFNSTVQIRLLEEWDGEELIVIVKPSVK